MKLPSAEWRSRPGLDRLLRALGALEGETRFVGGCVRDTLLGLPVGDVDLATRLTPEDVIDRIKTAGLRAVPTGLAHGTVTAVIGGAPVEVTTLRRDVSTDGRRATIAYTDSWREDAARRDFTVNALSADPGDGSLFDYFGGRDDLESRRIRFIGDPFTRIAEDHLRILRFFRFHARFGVGEPDAAGLSACAARANDLMALSRERIADELLKLIALPDPAATLLLMVDRGILAPVLPEIGEEGCRRLERLAVREQAAGIAPHPIRRLASLLPTDPEIADDVGARLRLSNAQRKRLRLAAAPAGRRGGSALQRSHRVGADAALDRLLLGPEEMVEVRRLAAELAAASPAPLPVKGSDLIERGVPKGPLVARTLQRIERAWVDEDFPADERLEAIVRDAVDQALRSTQ